MGGDGVVCKCVCVCVGGPVASNLFYSLLGKCTPKTIAVVQIVLLVLLLLMKCIACSVPETDKGGDTDTNNMIIM